MKPIKMVLTNPKTIKDELFNILDEETGMKECRIYKAKDYTMICIDKEKTNAAK